MPRVKILIFTFVCVVDVIEVLTNSKIPRNYWSDLKHKLIKEGSELHEKIVQLKLKSNKDGKSYVTDTLDTEGILRLIERLTIIEIKDIQINGLKQGLKEY